MKSHALVFIVIILWFGFNAPAVSRPIGNNLFSTGILSNNHAHNFVDIAESPALPVFDFSLADMGNPHQSVGRWEIFVSAYPVSVEALDGRLPIAQAKALRLANKSRDSINGIGHDGLISTPIPNALLAIGLLSIGVSLRKKTSRQRHVTQVRHVVVYRGHRQNCKLPSGLGRFI